jgi:hypothetical protein
MILLYIQIWWEFNPVSTIYCGWLKVKSTRPGAEISAEPPKNREISLRIFLSA